MPIWHTCPANGAWGGYHPSMFSYRHAFHAGAHSDVLKHTALIAVLKYLTEKETALTTIDTHAGAGLYRLDGDFATKSDEASNGIAKIYELYCRTNTDAATKDETNLSPAFRDYLDLIGRFNQKNELKVYPGSPFVIQQFLRKEARDKLKLFELHPADHKALVGNIAQLDVGRQVAIARDDGFEGLKAFLPPPSRRGFVLIDPSYEIKSDYAKVSACIQDCLIRFPTGTYMVWYPIIPRPEAHDLPRRLKTIAKKAGKPFLIASLAIGAEDRILGEEPKRPGLTASGLFIINPPHTLKGSLELAGPQILEALRRGRGAEFALSSA
jgi:23S rRNA (adenine2030-N6)-methyltransferase